MGKIKESIKEKLSTVEGSKRVFDFNKIVLYGSGLITILVVVTALYHALRENPRPEAQEGPIRAYQAPTRDSHAPIIPGGVTAYRDAVEMAPRRLPQRPQKAPVINYLAPQVLVRPADSSAASGAFMAIHGRFVGRIATPVNTKEGGRVEVILPYGGGHLPPHTALYGRSEYLGEGSKVFIQFSKARTPDGRHFRINAHALDSKDYSRGLTGKGHSGNLGRTAALMGLAMASGMTEVLTQKQVLGSREIVTPKSTMRNALYHGTSKVTNMLAQQKAQKAGNAPAYVTINAGEVCIVEFSPSSNE